MKVKKINIQNIKSISDQEVNFNGCTAIITGGNNKGKTTLLRSFIDRIRGSKNANIIKQGEKEGSCEYELTDGSKFLWKISSDGKEKLSFVTKEGIEIKKGIIKEIGNKFFGEGFDIDEFLNSEPKQQKNKLQKILGIDLTALEEEYEKLYRDRTDANTILKNEIAKDKDFDIPEESLEVKDISSMESKFKAMVDKNKSIELFEFKVENKEKLVESLEKEKEEMATKVKYLLEKMESHTQQIVKEKEDIRVGNEWLNHNPKEDSEELYAELEQARQNNYKIRSAIEQNEAIRKQKVLIEEARVKWEKLDKEVKENEKKRFEIMKGADMPEGFELTDSGLLYNGFALDKNQLSSSSVYIASLKIASMALGEIKTMCFDASYLDRNSLKKVEVRASKQGYQLLIERPDFDGGEIKYEIIQEDA